jgi:hypothetical protein
MNKIQNFLAIPATCLALCSCGLFDTESEYVGGDFSKLVQGDQEWNDTIDVVDNLGIQDSYKQRLYSHTFENFDFEANGNINEIHVKVRIECSKDGGNLVVLCGENDSNTEAPTFTNLDGDKMTNAQGYTIRMLDSLKVGNSTYRNVFEFDATDVKNNKCIYDKFYINASKGLLRINLQDSIKIERQ